MYKKMWMSSPDTQDWGLPSEYTPGKETNSYHPDQMTLSVSYFFNTIKTL